MTVPTLQFREAEPADLPAILEIYNDAVLTTTAVWDDTPRSESAHRDWFAGKRAQGHPVLVVERAGRLAGFGSYGPFRPWPGYRFTVENSIYTHREHRRMGVARQLLLQLIAHAQRQGMHCIIGGIEAENLASIRLHESVGYTQAACLHQVGRKFDRWLDLVLMERRL